MKRAIATTLRIGTPPKGSLMTTSRMLVTAAAAAVALLVALATGGSVFEPDHAFTKGGGGGGAGAGAAGSGGAAGNAEAASASAGVAGTGGGQGDGGNDEGTCRTLTQTIDVGGQTVPASGVVCRQPDGTWRLNETQSAQLVPTPAGNEPSALTERAASSGRRCERGGAVPCAASGLPRRVRVAATRPHRPAESAIDRPNR
jgi:hypothetical protein